MCALGRTIHLSVWISCASLKCWYIGWVRPITGEWEMLVFGSRLPMKAWPYLTRGSNREKSSCYKIQLLKRKISLLTDFYFSKAIITLKQKSNVNSKKNKLEKKKNFLSIFIDPHIIGISIWQRNKMFVLWKLHLVLVIKVLKHSRSFHENKKFKKSSKYFHNPKIL